jgi:ankyrin repeat protein
MVKFLVSKGAKPQQGDYDGLLPIDYAKRYSRREVVQFLEGL